MPSRGVEPDVIPYEATSGTGAPSEFFEVIQVTSNEDFARDMKTPVFGRLVADFERMASVVEELSGSRVEPGYTATDLNQHLGTQTVEEGAEVIVSMAQIGPDGPTGGYFGADGHHPW